MTYPRNPVLARRLSNSLLILLLPGVSLKRWLIVGAVGLLAMALGVLFALDVSTGPAFISFARSATLEGEPAYLRGAVFIAIGILAALFAAYGLYRSFGVAGQRPRHWNILESLYVERILGSGPRITVIGGGSGLPSLLRGIKQYTSNVTAIVTMADDGGSSGRLRDELGIQPPGDIRNCLVALADSEEVMQRLMDYRFSSDGELDGHSFGNILIAALAGIGGDFYRGVEIAGELLAIRGRVVPSTNTDVTLIGTTETGETLVGETNVAMAQSSLLSLSLSPPDPAPHPEAIRALLEADLVIIGPGSLYTSIVPNLVISGIARALNESKALKVYVCNVAEEPRQTEGYTVFDHLEAVRHYAGMGSVDAVVANSRIPEGPTPAGLDFIPPPGVWPDDTPLVTADVIDDEYRARHNSQRLAGVIATVYRRQRGRRRRLPWARINPTPAPMPAGYPATAPQGTPGG